MTSHLTRRRALGLGLGIGAAALTGITLAPTAQAADGQIVRGSFSSRYRNGESTAWEVLYPPGYGQGDYLPVLICLHGHGGDQTTPESMRFLDHAQTLHDEGARPFVAVGVAGGDTWWHGHDNGYDSSAMVVYELLPMLGRMGLDIQRPALYGLSMGGMGAIWLAENLGPSRISSLVFASTPFPLTWNELDGSYDSPANFAYNDIRRLWHNLEGMPIRCDIGDQDPFLQRNLDLQPTADPQPEFYVSSGAHEWSFWSRVALDELRFVSQHF